MTQTIYDFDVIKNDGSKVSLGDYQGKVLLIVNTASKCGFTNQYEGMEQLQKKYGERGFSVLAFPCNQFGAQEPGSDEEIASFCQTNYNHSFPLFKKIDVNGDEAAPLYQHLKEQAPGLLGSKAIKWNFTKFLVGKDGAVVDRYAPQDKPESLEGAIEKAIG